MLRVLLTANK